ncbi:hypothetical protein GmHk_14G041181 [Glycine max]|nr:hypothetical protein GmHk_14G041181 [Glycine max]
MAPKKLSIKRSRKDATGESSSATLEFDSHWFWSSEHQQCFEAIKGWSFHRERRVQLREDKYPDFQEEIARRRWAPLMTPMAKFDLEILIEFYANACPLRRGFGTCAQGDESEEDQQCEFSQRRNQADDFDEEAIAQLICISGKDFA